MYLPRTWCRDGDFNYGGGWRTSKHSWLGIEGSGTLASGQHEGNRFGVTNTSVPGGGIYQDVSFPVARGDNFCASADVVTAGAHPGARGSMTVWLLGDTASQSSSVVFGSLPGEGRWTPVTTCVTATTQHSYLRLQIYDVPRTPTLGIDAVDLHQSFVENGGLDRGGVAGWRTSSHSWFAIEPAGELASGPYEGNGFGVTNTTEAGGGIYQDIPLAVSAGDSFCADAEVVTAGAGKGARGEMTIWLLGETAGQSSSVAFGSLPGSNRWTQVSTCVTATGSHSDVRIQFYDVPRTPTLGIDAVDLHQSFVENGDFNAAGSGGWRDAGSRFAIELAGRLVKRQHTGTDFGVLAPSRVGGRLYQDIALPISAGESFCADADVFTAGARPGARGDLTIFLYGRSRTQSSSVAFGPLPLRNRRTAVAACVTGIGSHSDIRVQLYDAPKSPALGVDAVDVR